MNNRCVQRQNVTMCCEKGDDAFKKAKETLNSANVKDADPSRQIQLYGSALC